MALLADAGRCLALSVRMAPSEEPTASPAPSRSPLSPQATEAERAISMLPDLTERASVFFPFFQEKKENIRKRMQSQERVRNVKHIGSDMCLQYECMRSYMYRIHVSCHLFSQERKYIDTVCVCNNIYAQHYARHVDWYGLKQRDR